MRCLLIVLVVSVACEELNELFKDELTDQATNELGAGMFTQRKGILAVPIFHTRHEGSHAISGSLVSRSCVFNIKEYLDVNNYYSSHDQVLAYKQFLNPSGIDAKAMSAALLRGNLNRTHPRDARLLKNDMLRAHHCHKQGFLTMIIGSVRINAISALRKLGGIPDTNFFVLARTDIMRFSLSIYQKGNFSQHYAQFAKKSRFQKMQYELESLERASRNIRDSYWKFGVNFILKLKEDRKVPCERIHIIRYEDFLENSTAFCIAVHEVIARGHQGIKSAHGSNVTARLAEVVRKVHSVEISKFVENSAEVINYYQYYNESYDHYLKIHLKNACQPDTLFLSHSRPVFNN